MAFKLALALDVRQWLKGTADVEDSLDDVGDSLNDLARESAQDADKAADNLSREFSDAFDKVKTEARTTGDAIGADLKHGADEASEGTKTFKENAASNAKEVAASFDGSAQSIADGFQGLAAEAFEGFGPAGVAAGVAAGAGIGLISKAFELAEEQAEKTKERIVDIREELQGVGGDITQLDYASAFREWGEETTDGAKNIDRMRQFAVQLGLDQHTLFLAWTGDEKAKQEVQDAYIAKQKEINDLQAGGDISDSLRQRNSELNKNNNLLKEHSGEVGQAAGAYQVYSDFVGNSADAQDEFTAAQERATNASEVFSDSLTGNLSVADEGLKDFVKDGKLSLEEWSQELKRRQRENARIENFTVDIAPKLSAEALENFAQLPTETQAQIEKAYRTGSKKDRKTVVANLEAEAKVSKVSIDTSGAQKTADSDPITVPTTVSTSGMSADVAKAASEGQREADKTVNVIEFQTKIDRDELQRQVDRAAASIHPPTITVKTKVQKEVP